MGFDCLMKFIIEKSLPSAPPHMRILEVFSAIRPVWWCVLRRPPSGTTRVGAMIDISMLAKKGSVFRHCDSMSTTCGACMVGMDVRSVSEICTVVFGIPCQSAVASPIPLYHSAHMKGTGRKRIHVDTQPGLIARTIKSGCS